MGDRGSEQSSAANSGKVAVAGSKSVDGESAVGDRDGYERVEAWMRGRLSTWEVDKPLTLLGLDSLDLVQLRNAFNKNFYRMEGSLAEEVPLSIFSNANQTLNELM